MPGYEELHDLRLDRLSHAVAEWDTAVGQWTELERQARAGVLSRVKDADWAGLNADVTRERITRTARQFTYGYGQVEAVRNIMRDLRDGLEDCRRRLRSLKAEAEEQGLYILTTGRVIVPPAGEASRHRLDPNANLPTPAGEPPTPLQVEAMSVMTGRIAAILGEAEELDRIAARALEEVSGDDDGPFHPGGLPFSDLESAEAAQGRQDAREALALIRRRDDLTEAELHRLVALFTEQQNNEDFAVLLASSLGAEETLQFWEGMLNGENGGKDGQEDALRDLGRALGVTLGVATRSESAVMQDWQDDIIAMGMERVLPDRALSPYGFQIMSDLMRHGEYDAGFLDAYGTALMTGEEHLEPGMFWRRSIDADPYQQMAGSDFRTDPMTGYMEALSRNPDAATDFFSDEEKRDYVLRERPAMHFERQETGEDGGRAVMDSTGQALLAAATGINPHDPDFLPTDTRPEHKAVLDQVLALGLEQENAFPPEFREHAARMLSVHRSDVYLTAGNSSGSSLPLDASGLSVLVNEISRSPEAYVHLHASMIPEYVERLHGDTTGNPSYELDKVGQAIGFLEQGRFEAVEIDKEDPTWAGKNTYNILGAAFGAAPVVGTPFQHAVDQATSRWVEHQKGVIEQGVRQAQRDYYDEENQFLNQLAGQWLELHPIPADEPKDVGFEAWKDRVERSIRESANTGRVGAESSSGKG